MNCISKLCNQGFTSHILDSVEICYSNEPIFYTAKYGLYHYLQISNTVDENAYNTYLKSSGFTLDTNPNYDDIGSWDDDKTVFTETKNEGFKTRRGYFGAVNTNGNFVYHKDGAHFKSRLVVGKGEFCISKICKLFDHWVCVLISNML